MLRIKISRFNMRRTHVQTLEEISGLQKLKVLVSIYDFTKELKVRAGFLIVHVNYATT